MVVSEEVNPDSTTTENTEKETSPLLKLDYDSAIEEDVNPLDIIADTPIKDDIPYESSEPKTVTLIKEAGIETGIEIQYTSMKLKNFPIKDSNISHYEKEIEQISLGNTTLHIGETPLLNVNLRIVSFNKFKIFEFKTREFKLGLSIKLENNTLIKEGDFFRYEIFSKLKNSRLNAVADLIRRVFSGERLSFHVKDLHGDIIFENPIQSHKFGMILKSITQYESVESIISPSKSKAFSDTSMDFYTLHLLHCYLEDKKVLNSWLNFKVENKDGIREGDSLVFIKEHPLDFRGINYSLQEKIVIKDQISQKDINEKSNSIVGYRKLVEIQLEKVEK